MSFLAVGAVLLLGGFFYQRFSADSSRRPPVARVETWVAAAFDHGVKLRERVLAELADLGREVVDLGTDDAPVRIDLPDKARELGPAIRSGGRRARPAGVRLQRRRRSPPARSPASARPSATTSTPRTRGSSTTT